MGSIGIGFAGGFGVLVLAMVFGIKPGSIPVDVILIIMSVIAAIAAMQVAGGLDYMVHLAEKILRSNPKYITFLAPVVTYVMTLFAGTGHTAFSTLPVIAEVAKETGIRPSRPLSIATVASQIAITASPISAAVIFFSNELEPLGVSYIQLLMISIPSSFIAVMIGAVVANFLGKDLKDDPIYQDRLAKGLVKTSSGREAHEIKKGAKTSVLIFLLGLICVVFYATAISSSVGLIKDPVMPRDEAIMTVMLAVASLIAMVCKIKTGDVLDATTFKSGMSACVCVLGVAWLGTTFVAAHLEQINIFAGSLLETKPWLVSALFVLPTYPSLLAAIEFDDTGSTRIGKYVFDHPFLIPGTVTIAMAVVLGFLIGPMVI
ncbi:MAG: anaerobic C4-dicarboxylate transporter [Desulfosarcina sp.]|nr:anaerobic C4-dicarboxylate transporter [Desulfosarcina sp.]MBC2768230.1 anaerobic C4-dicarboxylate transporter [Desulfosarcina sp.]